MKRRQLKAAMCNEVYVVAGSSMERHVVSETAMALNSKEIAKDKKESPKLAVMRQAFPQT